MSIIYTPEELAKVWKVSTMTIYKLINQNKIPHFRVGRSYRIPEEHLQAYAEREGNLGKFLSKKGPVIPEVVFHFLEFLKKEPKSKQKNVLEIRLFGSYARGEATKDSDVDLFVLLEKMDRAIEHWVYHLGELAMEADDYNDFLSSLIMEREHWKKHERLKTPLFRAIEQDGIVLWPKQ